MTVLPVARNGKGASDVVGERLRDLRKSRRMSVEDLAAQCRETGSPELTANALYAIENGRKKGGARTRHVTVDELLALGRALDVSPLALLNGDDLTAATSDMQCPKCGSDDTNIAYCDGCRLRPYSAYDGNHIDNKCADGDPEHFHRNCRRCHYQWRTDDVINPRKVCER